MNDDTVREDPTTTPTTTMGTQSPTHDTATEGHVDAPESPPTTPGPPRAPRGPSATTVVYGLVLTVVALLLLGRELQVFEVDPVQSGVALLLGSGALLVVWALTSMVGRRDREAAGDS